MTDNQSPNESTMFLTVTVMLNPVQKEEIHPKNPSDYISCCPWSLYFVCSQLQKVLALKRRVFAGMWVVMLGH